jgi:uncharacterized membrane protein YccC
MYAELQNRIFPSFRVALHYSLIALLAYFGAYYLTSVFTITSHFAPVGALWAMIVGISVAQHTWQATAAKALTQILGGVVGAIASIVYLVVLPVNPFGMVVLIGIAVFACQVMDRPDYSVSAGLTVGVIMFFSIINPELPPLLNVGLRFTEVVIGSVIAVLVVQLISRAENRSW